ncbi:MAG: hypothetical protein DWQ19_11075 [Crenarchaeota archaeon]|nr:MAG: hypothetical protein DWQ19_11075 [Thermoproteota archaeon]
MSSVIRLSDQHEVVKTSKYPKYAKFPFEYFNPVQSRIFEIYDQECNIIISAATSAGKTVMSEMVAAHQLRKNGGKMIYLAPMRALAKEKYDDWTDPSHHFSDLNIAICTGDYRLTPQRKKELEAANIIILTTEMVNSRCRNYKSEQNDWLIKDTKLCICDEGHLLTVPGRGDHAEVGMMNLATQNKNIRFVVLSATMPNVEEIAEWVGDVLTKKKTYLVESSYRPCPLGVHYEMYEDVGLYEQQEREKVNAAVDIIHDYPEDKFLLFVHTKRTGDLLKKELKNLGFIAEFHNADLDKSKRTSLENRFKKGDLKYLIATSTVAWGCNTPARRVVILGVHRGLSEVANYDIFQEVGRSGRPGYDPRGDAYILLPKSQFDKYYNQLKKSESIESRLLDNVGEHYKTLAFHLVSEIHHGGIRNRKDVLSWYEKTLAHFQAKGLDDDIIDSTIDLLLQRGAIKEENGTYKATTVGVVSSMFYYSPFDVADLRRNFTNLFNRGKEDDELHLSMALGDIDSLRMGIVSKAERAEIGPFYSRVRREYGQNNFYEAAIKGGFCYYCSLNCKNPGNVASTARTLQWDFPRLVQVLHALDSIGCKWDRKDFFETLEARVSYGVEPHLLPFVKLPGIGKVRAERLWSVGIKSLQAIVADPDRVRTVLNMKSEKIMEIVEAAKGQILLG